MDDADYGAPAPAESSNPFLSNADFEVSALAENPFLSAMGGVADQGAPQYMAAGTNPFAAFAAEPVEDAAKPANFFGNEARASIPELGTPYPQPYEGQVAPQVDMYQAAEPEQSVRQLPSTLDLNKSEQDYCMETSEIFSGGQGEPLSGSSSPNKGGPRRPPPPRPVPPSQETVNLILSVTGEMEATSSHLLDRLPPTRTPSPTLIRDLQTPSPTPETGFSDLLDVGGGAAPDTTGAHIPQPQEVNLLGDLDDISAPMPPAPTPSAEVDAPRRPPAPGRPPGGPPIPPKNVNDIMNLFEAPAAAPPAPEPVDLLGSTVTAPTATIFDMGQPAAPAEPPAFVPVPEPEPEPVVEAAATTVPPVRKLSSPSVPPVRKLSSPSVPAPPSVTPVSVTPPSTTPSVAPGPPPKPPPPRPAPPPVVAPPEPAPVQPPLPPPPVEEPVQQTVDVYDLPAAPAPAPELPPPPAPIVPKEQSPPKGRDEIMNLFGADQAAANAFSSAPVQMTDDFFGSGGGFAMEQQPAAPPVVASPTAFPAPVAPPPKAAPVTATDNDFDVFAAKFESAGTTTLTSDPFDPFAGSGTGGDAFAGGGDAFGGADDGKFLFQQNFMRISYLTFSVCPAWGSSTGVVDGTGGFGGEETFDEFLSMQQPPKSMARTASGDSDEQDFSVVIRCVLRKCASRSSTGCI